MLLTIQEDENPMANNRRVLFLVCIDLGHFPCYNYIIINNHER